MARSNEAEGFYVAAARFVEECLRREGSLFTAGTAIWSEGPISDLYERFVGRPDESKGVDFTTKLLGQLTGAPAEVFQLAAEMYYVLLAPQYTDGGGKRMAVEAVLNASPEPVAIPEDLILGLQVGIASYGAALTRRFDQYVFLCEFARAWVGMPIADREALLAKPFEFRNFAVQVPHKGAQAQLEALIHMVFPDAFETTVSLDQKNKIAAAFAEYVTDQTAPLDRQLQEIRAALTPERGENFSFYDEPLVSQWLTKDAAPEESTPESDEADLHVVVKWSPDYEPDTIAKHQEVVEEHGAVWWALFSQRTEPRQVGQRWLDQLRAQIDQGRDTFMFISGETCWRTRLHQVETDREQVDPKLIPSYYKQVRGQQFLWLKVSDFEQVTRTDLIRELDPANRPGKQVALGGRTTPLWVRLRTRPRVWWVNQGDSYRRARDGGYLWAPQKNNAGRTERHHEALRFARAGDVVINYAGQIRAVSRVTGDAFAATRPDPERDQTWQNDGWQLNIAYHDLTTPVLLAEIPEGARRSDGEGGTFDKNGEPNQGYMFWLSDALVSTLRNVSSELAALLPKDNERLPEPSETAVLTPEPAAERTLEEMSAAIRAEGLEIDDDTLRRYHLSLNSRRGFVILAGVSGTGKTWLAEAYARAANGQLLVVPVAPNWTTNEDLLGYRNPINDEYYNTDFSHFLRAAAEAYEQHGSAASRYHLVLDEMNLARVEYYFAKFLSAMEQRARSDTAQIELAPEDDVCLPPNLYVTGTINVDETTHAFSDKVYDRAQLIELPVERDELARQLDGRPYKTLLLAVWDELHIVAPFAYRVIDEINDYVSDAERAGVSWETALDEQLVQKVLPKIKGTDLRLRGALEKFIQLAADRFPLSATKAETMLAAFTEHGFTSYF